MEAAAPECGRRAWGGAVTSRLLFLLSRSTMYFSVFAFLFEGAAYNLVFLWRVLPARGKEFLAPLFLLLFNPVLALAMWSYFKAHVADPGVVPKRWQEFVLGVGDALPIAPARLEWQPGKATFCTACHVPRPERAHHCRACGVCVLRMDHHCPWISNCVGFHNYKFFLLLGVYSFLASAIAIATALPELLWCGRLVLRLDAGLPSLPVSDSCIFLLFGSIALLFVGLLAPMLASHVPLAVANRTTIECRYANMPNPYDRGSGTSNLAQTFGACGTDWFFPVEPFRPLSDGISFACADEHLRANGLPEAAESLMGDEDEEETRAEKLWRIRYHVPPPALVAEKRGMQALSTLAHWWRGADEPEHRRVVSL